MEKRYADISIWVYAVLYWLKGLVLFLGGLALIFLAPFIIAMIQAQPDFVNPDLPPGALEALASGLGAVVGIVLAILVLFFIIVGVGLVQRKNWARIATVVFSVFDLFSFPIGTIFGAYGIYAFGFEPAVKEQFKPVTTVSSHEITEKKTVRRAAKKAKRK